jgi:hypothetical protein
MRRPRGPVVEEELCERAGKAICNPDGTKAGGSTDPENHLAGRVPGGEGALCLDRLLQGKSAATMTVDRGFQ